MKSILLLTGLLAAQGTTALAASPAVTDLLQSYQSQGATTGNADTGKQLWNKTYAAEAPNTQRSCTNCHTDNLGNTGKHASTGKAIKPLAPSVNAESLTDRNKIEKWFKRNCKWTLGRECDAQEKSDLLTFISQQ
ncbi:MAG: DUF1924 domain-containing protein [Gammaproteobacteria bacterium]|nr:DUF1924 domain-containing protein [Gammaproteobacteria bacterium]